LSAIVLEEALQMRNVLLLRPLLRLGDVDEGQQRKLVGAQRVTIVGGALAQVLVELVRTLLGDEHGCVAEAQLCRDLDRLGAPGPDHVAGWMRLLIRPRPWVQEAIGVELTIVGCRTVLGPGLQHDLQ
jgi:hypothetical protein